MLTGLCSEIDISFKPSLPLLPPPPPPATVSPAALSRLASSMYLVKIASAGAVIGGGVGSEGVETTAAVVRV